MHGAIEAEVADAGDDLLVQIVSLAVALRPVAGGQAVGYCITGDTKEGRMAAGKRSVDALVAFARVCCAIYGRQRIPAGTA